MIYTQIPDSYRYEVLADAVYGRELEHFHYNFDRINFEQIIGTLPEGEYKASVTQRHIDTVKQMAIVEAIYSALIVQIDNEESYREAVKRVTKKREDAKCVTQK